MTLQAQNGWPLWNQTLLTSYVDQGAVCLDGSPAGYYLHEGDPNKWIVAFQGGGWCTSDLDCLSRSKTTLGSSTQWPAFYKMNGIGLYNSTLNPDFYNWTSLMVYYCDGASFAGDLTEPLVVNGTPLYMRGHRIVNAVLDDLTTRHGLGAAQEVIVNGGSAGGLAAQLHVDYIADVLKAGNPSVRVVGVPDCGFFIDGVDVFGRDYMTGQYQNVVAMQNITSPNQVDADCMNATPAENQWQCFMAQFNYPHVQSPLFNVNSMYDAWQLPNILAPPGDGADKSYAACFADPAHACNATQYAQFQGYAIQFMTALNMSRAFAPNGYNSVNGGFITSCVQHGQLDAPVMNTLTIDGTTMIMAIGDWYYNRSSNGGSQWYVDGQWPNNPTCPGPLNRSDASAIVTAPRDGVFNVLDYGAKGDGKTYDTAAIRATFAAAGAAGGGVVLFPSGYTFLSGCFNVSGNTNVVVEGRLQGGYDSTDYVLVDYLPWYGPDAAANPADPREWQAFFQSWYVDNITISGSGVIDMGGTAEGWWSCASNSALPPCNGHPRPHGIRLVGANGIEIRDVTIQNSPMWTTHISYSTNVWIHNVSILAPSTSHNTDGIDVDCSQHVLIEDSYISNGDDCVCMKSGINWYGRTYGRPTAHVVVRNTVFGTGHGITIGSEMSAGVYNVTFENLFANGTGTGVRLKSERGRGGVISNITYRNITLVDIQGQAVQMTLNYAKNLPPTNATGTPQMYNVTVENVQAFKPQYGWFIDGLPESPLRDIHFVNVSIQNPTKSMYASCDNITQSTCDNVTPECPPCISQ